jgi:hypothetical protein
MNEDDKICFDMDTKTEYTEALISTKVVADKLKVPRTSVFLRFSTPVGIRRSVPALLAADTPSYPLAEILSLDKQPA